MYFGALVLICSDTWPKTVEVFGLASVSLQSTEMWEVR